MSLKELVKTRTQVLLLLISSLTHAQDTTDTTSTLSLTTTLPPTTTTSIVSVLPPTAVPSSNSYTLLGCYNEVPLENGNLAVGAAGEYLVPSIVPENFTAPTCLAACEGSLAPEGQGNYTYAALENSRECFCGLSLSNTSTPVDSLNCASPCAGDSNTSCGGFGYLTLYQLTATLSTSNLTIPNTTTPANSTTSPITPASTSQPSNTGLWIGISFGLLALILLIALLLYFENRHYLAHHLGPPPFSPHQTRLPRLPFVRPNRESYLNTAYTATVPETISEKKGPERRSTLEAWKSGTVLPPPILEPVFLGGALDEEAQMPVRRESLYRPEYNAQVSFRDVAFASVEDGTNQAGKGEVENGQRDQEGEAGGREGKSWLDADEVENGQTNSDKPSRDEHLQPETTSKRNSVVSNMSRNSKVVEDVG
ncbi:hypothetical protein GLAREA_01452 [Glarea lozoyensis ATCC 20868]|uniref:WSC domain-containing protein n=1 Tax=Glarea lozoyensis (strain ATCC 20868 / MF5171) TaxID=1116229 RepID=S3CI62_GLAL2|nr:uncharacterized protein GLAREA_01452 [Glarea lozoyensis ATCC 20868]EPE25540.1 hypothetical protein GLAREA_01452 [Glarea lozoyensis ATCC 20868]